MATVTFVTYRGGQIHTERTNNYIADGHGDEVLVRTNRYITGDHACGNRCVGVNCPSDPVLATEVMENLRLRYEANLGDRKTKGTKTDMDPISHYQLIISWHTDESVPADERIEMTRELIERCPRLKNHAHLLSPHDNKDEDHIHDSLSAYSLPDENGQQKKLAMNNKLLYELRREMDHICVEHGYSIVESPELWGDKEFKEWFQCVKDLEVVTVHPPRPKDKKKTKGQAYADAKKAEREAEEKRRAELEQANEMTEENRGTHYYGLPHVYDPAHPDEQLYVFALDADAKRLSPLQLDLTLQHTWATKCREHLKTMADFPGKKSIMTRITWAEENAEAALDLMAELDIGTRAELKSHLKAVGGDVAKYGREVDYQSKVVTTAQERGDRAKLERALARKARAEKMLEERNAEYRRLKRAEAVLDGMDSGEHWSEFRAELLKRSTNRLRVTERREKVIRDNYHDIGQVMGIPQERIDRIIADAKAATPDEIEAMWVVFVKGTRITYTQRKSGLSAIYEYIGHLSDERRQLQLNPRRLETGIPVVDLMTSMLFLVAVVPLAVHNANKESELDLKIAYARRVAEEIRWHNQNCEEQLELAKQELARKLAVYEGAEAAKARLEFYLECEKLMARTRELKAMEAGMEASAGMTYSSVRDMSRDIEAAKVSVQPPADGRKPSLDDTIANAGRRSTLTTGDREKEQTH